MTKPVETPVKKNVVKITVEYNGITETWEYGQVEIEEKRVIKPDGDLTDQFTLSIFARKEVY